MSKKALSVILIVAMLVSLMPSFVLPVLAASGDISSMNALDALGIDTSLLPEGYDPNSTENPYGRDTVTVKPVYELFTSGVNKTSTTTSTEAINPTGTRTITSDIYTMKNSLFGNNKALNKTLDDFYTNQATITLNDGEAYREVTIKDDIGSAVTSYTAVSIAKVAAAASVSGNFIGTSVAGISGQVATVAAGSLSKNGGLYLYFTDADSGETSAAKTLLSTEDIIGNSGNKMNEDFLESPYLMQNYLKIATGDFDNNGIDEIAVYVAEQGSSRVEIYKLAITSGSADNAYLTASNWNKVWTYYFNENPYVSNMVSLTAGDFNRNGTDDLALTWGYYYGPEESNACQAVVLYGSSSTMLQTKKTIELKYNTANIVRAAFAYGDIDGDNVNDLVLGGQLSTDINAKNANTRFVGVYSYDGTTDSFLQSVAKNFNLFEKKDGVYVNTKMAGRNDKYYSSPAAPANIATVNMNGIGKAAFIYLDSLLIEYGSEGLTISMALDQNASFNKNFSGDSVQKYYVEYGVVAADFTGNCKETLQMMQYYVPAVKTIPEYLYWWYRWLGIPTSTEYAGDLDMLGVYGNTAGLTVKRTDANFTNSFCKLNTDKDTTMLKYTGNHYVQYTDPKVLAVVASAPYFADLDNDTLSGSYMQSETSYTSSSGSGSGSSTSNTLNIGAYVSFEQEFSVFGVKVASVEAELAYEHGWTWETEKSSMLEQSISYSTSVGEDAVAFYSIPMETYVYESLVPAIDVNGIVTGYNKQFMSVNIPHTASVKVLPLTTYEKIAADYTELPKISGNILTHKVGDPSTYPTSTAGYANAISYSGDWSGLNYGLGSVTQEISMTSETSKSFTNTDSLDMKAGGGAFGFVFGVSAGYEHGSSKVTVTTVGSSFVGNLYNMPTEAAPYGYGYSWKVFSYQYNGNGLSFPVVNYLVTDVTAPPSLPKDFQQDSTGTTDTKIKLTWSYEGAAAGFQIYRYYEFPDGSGSYELAFVAASDNTGSDGKGTRYFQFIDNGLDPYTEYDYQIQVVGVSQPEKSILSKVYTGKTKINYGYPEISLTGLDAGSILVYPDTDRTVEAIIANLSDYTQTPRYQWQKLTDDGWQDITGAINTKYTFKSVGLASEGQYRCRVNAIYESYYLSAYSEVFTMKYSKRTPMIVPGSFKVTETVTSSGITVPAISIELQSSHDNHNSAPTGNVTFDVKGADYSRSFTKELKISTNSGISIANLILTDPLPNGAYEITAYYSGSRVFKSLVSSNAIPYLAGDDSGYVLTLDSSYTYGDNFSPQLKNVTKTDGITSISAVTSTVTYAAVQYSWKWKLNYSELYGYSYYSIEQTTTNVTPNFVSTAGQAGNFTLMASVDDKVVAIKKFIVNKRLITIGIKDQNGEAGIAVHPTAAILTDQSINLAAGDTIADLGLAVKASNTAGTEITIGPDTDPGSYTITGTPATIVGAKYHNYSINYLPGTYILTGAKYAVTGIALPLNNVQVGTLKMVSPEENDNINWTNRYAGATTLVFSATPNTGYAVKKWLITNSSGTVIVSGGNTLTKSYQMKDEAIIVSVEFEVTQRILTYRGTASGGAVECTSSNVVHSGDVARNGAEFSFKATPAQGYHFLEWQLIEVGKNLLKPQGIAEIDGSNNCQIVMGSGDTTLIAVFVRDNYTINLQGDLQAKYVVKDDISLINTTITAISGDSIQGDKVVTIVPKPGFAVKDDAVWYKDNQPLSSSAVSIDNQSYSFIMTSNTAIAVETENKHYAVDLIVTGPGIETNKVAAKVNGIITTDLSDVLGGATLVFNATPSYGYEFKEWIVSGATAVVAGKTLTIAALSDNASIKAVFMNNEQYLIDVKHNLRGSLSYTLNGGTATEVASGGAIAVFKGDTVIIKATPEMNFMVENWRLNQVLDQTTSKTKTFANIASNLEVEVVFGAQTYSTVNYNVTDIVGSTGGAISAKSDGVFFASGNNSIGNGSELEFLAIPESGKMVDKWIVNGVTAKALDSNENLVATTYTIPALSGDVDVVVYFRDIVTHTVQIDTTNTTLTSLVYNPDYNPNVRDGAAAIFTIYPASNYRITTAQAIGNNGAFNGFDKITKQADGSWICIVNAVKADLTVSSEAKQLYNITIPDIYVGGNIVLSSDKAIENETVTITAVPANSYTFSSWSVTGGGVTLSSTTAAATSFAMPAADVSIKAIFTYNGGGGGGFIMPMASETFEPEDIIENANQVLVNLTSLKKILSPEAIQKLIERNRLLNILISGNGVRILIPAGSLKAGDNINDMIPDTAGLVGGLGKIIFYTDANGQKHIVPWSVLGHNLVSFIAENGGKYQVIDNSKKFMDINGHWGINAISFVTARELFLGTSNEQFSADAGMTRAMLVTVLHRLDGLSSFANSNFVDVPNNKWYSNAIAWVAANKIVDGYGDNNFDGNDNITREQLATIIYRYAEFIGMETKTKGSLAGYHDANEVAKYALVAIEWATENGLVSGRPGGLLDPTGNATRAEVAAVIQRLIEFFIQKY